MKYAVKVMLAADDWIFVTKDTRGKCWDLVPETFNTVQEAEQFANSWRRKGKSSNVKVVEYNDDDAKLLN